MTSPAAARGHKRGNVGTALTGWHGASILTPESIMIIDEMRTHVSSGFDECTRKRFDLLDRATPEQILAASNCARGPNATKAQVDRAWGCLERMV